MSGCRQNDTNLFCGPAPLPPIPIICNTNIDYPCINRIKHTTDNITAYVVDTELSQQEVRMIYDPTLVSILVMENFTQKYPSQVLTVFV